MNFDEIIIAVTFTGNTQHRRSADSAAIGILCRDIAERYLQVSKVAYYECIVPVQ